MDSSVFMLLWSFSKSLNKIYQEVFELYWIDSSVNDNWNKKRKTRWSINIFALGKVGNFFKVHEYQSNTIKKSFVATKCGCNLLFPDYSTYDTLFSQWDHL